MSRPSLGGGGGDSSGATGVVLTSEVRGELASCGHNMFTHVTSGSEALQAASNEYRASVSSVGKDMLTNPANTNLAIESLRQTAEDAVKDSNTVSSNPRDAFKNEKRKGRDRSFYSNNFILPTDTKRNNNVDEYQQDTFAPMQRPSLAHPESHTGHSDHFGSIGNLLGSTKDLFGSSSPPGPSGGAPAPSSSRGRGDSRGGGGALTRPGLAMRQDSMSNMLGMANHLPSSQPRSTSGGRPNMSGARLGSNMSLLGTGSEGNLMEMLDSVNAVQYSQVFNTGPHTTSLNDLDNVLSSGSGGRGNRGESMGLGSIGGDMNDVMLGGFSASDYFQNPGMVPTRPPPNNNNNNNNSNNFGYTPHGQQQYQHPNSLQQQGSSQYNTQQQRPGSAGHIRGFSGDADSSNQYDFDVIAGIAHQSQAQAQFEMNNGGGAGAGGYPYYAGANDAHAGNSGFNQPNGSGGNVSFGGADNVKNEYSHNPPQQPQPQRQPQRINKQHSFSPQHGMTPEEQHEFLTKTAFGQGQHSLPVESRNEYPEDQREEGEEEDVPEERRLMSGNRVKWSKFEDKKLREAVKKYGKNNWHAVASEVKHRTNVQCRARWKRVLDDVLKKGFWSPEEDAVLVSFVKEHRQGNLDAKIPWPELKGVIQGRLVKQCRERFTKNLDERLKKGEWTEEEDALIMREHDRIGRKWATIGRLLEGRTEHSVKTRFVTLSKRKGWTKQEDDSLMVQLRKCGTNWDKISKRLANGRSATAIQKRYQSLFAISMKKKASR